MTGKERKIGSNMRELNHEDGTRVLISYETPVAAWTPQDGWMRSNTYYKGGKSHTTERHINKWLEGEAAIVDQEAIDKLRYPFL